MNTLAISLIEKKPHHDGGTYDFLKGLEVFLIKKEARTLLLQEIIQTLARNHPILRNTNFGANSKQPTNYIVGLYCCKSL